MGSIPTIDYLYMRELHARRVKITHWRIGACEVHSRSSPCKSCHSLSGTVAFPMLLKGDLREKHYEKYDPYPGRFRPAPDHRRCFTRGLRSARKLDLAESAAAG